MILKGNVENLPKGLVEDLNTQSECIRNTTLVNFDRTNSIQTLSVLKNITKLVIEDYRHEDDVLGTIDLPNLRHLELIDSIPFAEVIGSQSLNILKIHSRTETRYDCSELSAGINNFLSKCHNLKNLTLSSFTYTNVNLKSEFFNFNLEALTIEYFNFDDESIAEFLVKQKNSLKKLAILTSSPIILQIMFSQLTLDELEIDVSIIPSNFNPQMVNKTIKKLTIMRNGNPNGSEHNPESATEKIILTCNAVKEFTFLNYSFDSLLQHLNWNLKSLKVLRLKTIPKLISPTNALDNFKSLEVIEIERIYHQQDIENCKFLILNSPNLKTLKINYMEKNIFISNFFIEIVTKSKNLREIHIGVRCFTSDMIDAMRQVKDLEHPLEFISVLFCSMDEKIRYDKNDALIDGLVLNFDYNSNKRFSLIINETRLKCIEREFDEKQNDLEHQRWCGIQRKLQIKKYERDQDVDTDSSDSSICVDISDFVRNLVVTGEIRMLCHQ